MVFPWFSETLRIIQFYTFQCPFQTKTAFEGSINNINETRYICGIGQNVCLTLELFPRRKTPKYTLDSNRFSQSVIIINKYNSKLFKILEIHMSALLSKLCYVIQQFKLFYPFKFQNTSKFNKSDKSKMFQLIKKKI